MVASVAWVGVISGVETSEISPGGVELMTSLVGLDTPGVMRDAAKTIKKRIFASFMASS